MGNWGIFFQCLVALHWGRLLRQTSYISRPIVKQRNEGRKKGKGYTEAITTQTL